MNATATITTSPPQPHHHYYQQHSMPARVFKHVIFASYALLHMTLIFLSCFLSKALARGRAISLDRKRLMICETRLCACTGLCYSHHLVMLGVVCA